MSDPTSPLIFDEDGQPRSRLYGDIYFSTEDGLAESRAVFLAGCGLPEAFAGRGRFTVAELGFGTGLNIATLLTLWRQAAPPNARLSIFSIEAHPMAAQDAARALAAWPEIADAADALTAAWPGRAAGFHRIDLPGFRATLDLAVMDAAPALEAWSGHADAWFLDGFAPAANPAMWTDEVLGRVAARSAPGARAATFTVAGQVRRGLAAAGFAVEKRPGHGRKRERLEARLAGDTPAERPPPRIAVLGAGIAGASLARALRCAGVAPVVVDIAGPGAGASGNAAALVTPGLDASGGPQARLYAQANGRAARLYGAIPGAIIAREVVRLAAAERDEARFRKIAAQPLFEADDMVFGTAAEMTARLGEAGPSGLVMRRSLVVEPAVVLAAWLDEVFVAQPESITRNGQGWRIALQGARPDLDVDVVVLAAGWANAALRPDLALAPVRGQATRVDGEGATPLVFGDYLIPTRDGVLFGATHDRDRADDAVDPADDHRNLDGLAELRPALATRLAKRALVGRAAIRAATPDRLPLAGAVEPGLFVLGGLGSRGFTTAPLLAEHVVSLILGGPSPLPADLAARIAPRRFGNRPE